MGSRHSDSILGEQVKLLHRNAPLAYLSTFINGTILVYIQRDHIALPVLIAWYGCVVLLTTIRALTAWYFWRIPQEKLQVRTWHFSFVAGTAAAGATWGAAALFLFPEDSPAHQAFVGFILAGMSAGAVATFSPRLEICAIFLLTALIPLVYKCFSVGGEMQMAMGVLTILFLLGMAIVSFTLYRSIRTQLELRFDNRDLVTEVDQRRRAEENLYGQKERLQTVLSSIAEAVVIVNADGRIDYINPAAERLTGTSAQSTHRRPVTDIFQSFDRHHRRIETAMEESVRIRRQISKQSVLYSRGGREHLVEEIATPLSDRLGNVTGAVSVLRDVTEALTKTERLTHAATHDPLTGLPNRNLLTDRTNQAIARAQRKHESFGLLFVDMDGFKSINDSLGHTIGDNLLIDVAKRLHECVRDEDTIARLGGDEFVVLLDGPTDERGVKRVADKILRAMRRPFSLGDRTATVTASIGSSLFPYDGQDAEVLLDRADAAMYRAKEQGRNRAYLSTHQ